MNRVARRERLGAVMAERGLAGFLVNQPSNVRYLTGYTGSNGIVCLGTRAALPDRLPLRDVGRGAGRRLAGRDRPAEPARRCRRPLRRAVRRRARRLRVVGAVVCRVAGARRGGARRGRRARPVRGRRRGSPRRQGRGRDRADPRRRRDVRPDLRLAGRGRTGGPRGARGRPGRSSGTRASSAPRARPSRRSSPRARTALSRTPCRGPLEIERSTLVVLDLGALVGGYCSDCTRTFATGPSEPQMMDVYETVLRAQEAALALVAPGQDCQEVHETARRVIDEAGYGEFFNHGTGHGVGIDMHEEPRFRNGCGGTLAAGQCRHGRAGRVPSRALRRAHRGSRPRHRRRSRGAHALPQVPPVGVGHG